MITFDGFCALRLDSVAGELMKTSSVDYATVPIAKLPNVEFGLLCHGPNGQLVRRFPMATPDLAKVSSAAFVGHASILPGPLVKGVAAALAERLGSYGHPIPRELYKLSGGEPRSTWVWDATWDELAHEMRPVKTSAPKRAVVHRIQVPANPLIPGHAPAAVEIRDLNDADMVRDWTILNRTKMSSLTASVMAAETLAAYGKLGVGLDSPWSRVQLAELRKLSAGEMRVDPSLWLEDRDDALDLVKESAALLPGGSEMVTAYRASLDEVRRLEATRKLDARAAFRYAVKISHMDEALGLQTATPAFQAFFHPGPTKLSEGSEVVYSRDATRLRERDLEVLRTANLLGLWDILGETVSRDLREDPVATFKGLTPSQQRFLANWIADVGSHVVGQTHNAISF